MRIQWSSWITHSSVQASLAFLYKVLNIWVIPHLLKSRLFFHPTLVMFYWTTDLYLHPTNIIHTRRYISVPAPISLNQTKSFQFFDFFPLQGHIFFKLHCPCCCLTWHWDVFRMCHLMYIAFLKCRKCRIPSTAALKVCCRVSKYTSAIYDGSYCERK